MVRHHPQGREERRMAAERDRARRESQTARKACKVQQVSQRLEYLRDELRGERISYGELFELQTLAPHIALDDIELLEAAGVPEGEGTCEN